MKTLSVSEQNAWLQTLLVSSVPLRKIGENGMPCGIASGCFIDVGERRLLLSVAHAVQSGKDWVIEIDHSSKLGTEVYRPSFFNYLVEAKLGLTEVREVDFVYAVVPNDLVSHYLEITPRAGLTCRVPRTIFKLDFSVRPSDDEMYGFAGQVKPEQHGVAGFATEMRVYPGLKYRATEGPYFSFELPVPP